jgi:hypothetical protein
MMSRMKVGSRSEPGEGQGTVLVAHSEPADSRKRWISSFEERREAALLEVFH